MVVVDVQVTYINRLNSVVQSKQSRCIIETHADLLYTRPLKAAIANKSCAEAAAGPVSSLHWVGASTAITAVAPAGRDTDRNLYP